MPKTKTTVLFKLDHIISDRNQYKPYIAHLAGENIYVEVNVPTEEARWLGKDGEEIVLTVDGLAAVMNNVATALEKMNRNAQKKSYGY